MKLNAAKISCVFSCLEKAFHARKLALAGVLFVATTVAAQAQEQWEREGEGEIKDVEIEIVKDRKITLPRAMRNFEKIAPRPFEPVNPAMAYEIRNLKFVTQDFKPAVKPLKLKQEEITRMYGNYLSAGLGNYSSFLLEGSVTTKRNKNKFVGAHLYTRNFGTGPVAGQNSASGTTQLDLFGKVMGRAVTLNGDAKYESRGAYFYAYNPAIEVSRDKIRQSYDVFGASASVENTHAADFNYTLKGGFSYLQDHYQETESEVSFAFNSDYKLNPSGKLRLNADYFLINRQDAFLAPDPRHLFLIKPSYEFSPVDGLLLTTGLNLAYQNDQYAGSRDFHVYPHVKASYELGKDFDVYGVVTGDMDKVNLHTLSAENIWLNSNINVYHTNRALEFIGGVKGKAGRYVAMGAGVSVASLKNFYYFRNLRDDKDPAGTSVGVAFDKFDLLYDANTRRVNSFAEISFARTETLKLALRGDYFTYQTDGLSDPLHRPTYRMSANVRYNLYEKISVEAGFIGQGGMKALDPVTQAIILLDPARDLNAKVRYFFSRQFSAFVQCNNILASNYPIYLGYQARGFQVMGGISWSL